MYFAYQKNVHQNVNHPHSVFTIIQSPLSERQEKQYTVSQIATYNMLEWSRRNVNELLRTALVVIYYQEGLQLIG